MKHDTENYQKFMRFMELDNSSKIKEYFKNTYCNQNVKI